jgi:hypothetical protein
MIRSLCFLSPPEKGYGNCQGPQGSISLVCYKSLLARSGEWLGNRYPENNFEKQETKPWNSITSGTKSRDLGSWEIIADYRFKQK